MKMQDFTFFTKSLRRIEDSGGERGDSREGWVADPGQGKREANVFPSRRVIIALAASAGLVAALAWCQPQAARASLIAGIWQLNTRLSEPPKAREGELGGGRRPGGPDGGMGGRRDDGTGERRGAGMGPGRPGGTGGHRGGGMGPDGGRGREGGPGGREAGLGGAASIMISLEDGEVHIISGDGRVRILSPNGQPMDRERGFLTVSETARWTDGRLLVTSTTPRGMISTETIGPAEDGSGRLVHTVEMKRAEGGETRSARWVYDKTAGT